VDWISCLILLGTAPFIPLLMVLIGGYAEGQARRQWQTLSRLAAAFLDTVQGVTTVLAFGQEEAKRAQLAARGERFRETTLRVLKLASLSGTVLELMSSLAIGVMAVALAIRLLDGGISFAHAILVFFLTPEFYRPLRELGAHYHAGMEGAVSGRRVVEVLEAPASTSVSPEVRTAPQPPFQIVLSHVSFCYPGSGGPALIDLHLTLEPGGMTAVVGRSGAGKSTLVSLLLRWIDPTDGAITVNGVPLTALSPADWRRCVSLVSQRPYLFSGSILDNIRLGNPHASRDEMRRSARLAGIDQFVAELPAGYDTPVGERGARLSAGQAQRVSLARAFLKDAPVLVLDEPTSFLDPASEAVIRDAVRSLASGRTALVVAHRLSTAAAADRVVVLDAGRVAEVGEPRELLSRGGPFAELATASRPAPQLTPVAGYGVGE
jgi:ATP-binding cassette subfamily C protein CydD